MSQAKHLSIAKGRRKHIRFSPDPGNFAQIEISKIKGRFKCEVVALIVDESSSGCKLVLQDCVVLHSGQQCRIKVGDISPMLCEVKWVKPIECHLLVVGFQYLD